MPVYWRRGGSATFDLLLQNSSITKKKSIGSFIVTLMNSPITKRCFVILSATKNLLFRCCFRDPLTMPPFRDPHGMSIAHATCDHSLSALSNPADFVALLARDDIVRGAFGGHSGTAPTAGKATRLCIYLTLYNGKNLLLGLLCKCLDLLGLLYKPVGSLAVLESGSVNLDVETCTHHRRACC